MVTRTYYVIPYVDMIIAVDTFVIIEIVGIMKHPPRGDKTVGYTHVAMPLTDVCIANRARAACGIEINDCGFYELKGKKVK